MEKDFIKHLRDEKLKQQDKRAEYIKTKFLFVLALISVATSLFNSDKLAENVLVLSVFLYIIPMVAFAFDLYILGGAFAIKRIKTYLAYIDNSNNSEKDWQSFVDKYEKSFMINNRNISTLIVLAISFLAIIYLHYIKSTPILQFWISDSIMLAIEVGILLYLQKKEKHIKAYKFYSE